MDTNGLINAFIHARGRIRRKEDVVPHKKTASCGYTSVYWAPYRFGSVPSSSNRDPLHGTSALGKRRTRPPARYPLYTRYYRRPHRYGITRLPVLQNEHTNAAPQRHLHPPTSTHRPPPHLHPPTPSTSASTRPSTSPTPSPTRPSPSTRLRRRRQNPNDGLRLRRLLLPAAAPSTRPFHRCSAVSSSVRAYDPRGPASQLVRRYIYLVLNKVADCLTIIL